MSSELRKRITPSTPFILSVVDADGGKFETSFQIAYDFNALCLIEKSLNINVLKQFASLLLEANAQTIAVLLWAGVQKNHPQYAGVEGLEIIGSNLTLESAKAAFAACIEALIAQLPVEMAAKIKASRAGNAVEATTADPTAAQAPQS